MELINNRLVGTPTALGEYNISLKASYNGSEITKNFIFEVTKNYTYLYCIGGIVVIVVVLLLVIKPKKRKK